MENLVKEIKLISPIDSIKIMINLFKGDKTIINIEDTYIKRLFINKNFLYFIASKQNYRENILLELDIILDNDRIKNHDVVKIILENESYINLIPELLDIQLEMIETSEYKNFFSQEQFNEWKKWLRNRQDKTHNILKKPMKDFLKIIDKYIDLYKTNPSKCGVYGLNKDFYSYCCEMNTTLPIGTKINYELLLEFAEKEQKKIERMIRNIVEKRKPILKELKLKKILSYLRSKSIYKYNSKEDFIERHQKEIDNLHQFYNKIFDYKIKCNFVDIDNNNFHGIYMYDTFFINATNWMNETTLTIKDLVAHETAPGHHMQITIDKEKNSKSNILYHYFGFLSNGFCEGWGLFAEKLIPNINEDDLLGILFGNIHRTIRVQADIMLNYKGVNPEKIYKLYRNFTMLTKKEIISEIKRIQVMPGQVLCYKLGDQVFRKIFIKVLSKNESLFTDKAMNLYKKILSNGSTSLELLLKKYQIPLELLFEFIEI
jgi:uncharacterized protein (DUF885 family)